MLKTEDLELVTTVENSGTVNYDGLMRLLAIIQELCDLALSQQKECVKFYKRAQFNSEIVRQVMQFLYCAEFEDFQKVFEESAEYQWTKWTEAHKQNEAAYVCYLDTFNLAKVVTYARLKHAGALK